MIGVYLQYLLLIIKGVSSRFPLLFLCDIIIMPKTRRHNNDANDEEATTAVIQSFLRPFRSYSPHTTFLVSLMMQ